MSEEVGGWSEQCVVRYVFTTLSKLGCSVSGLEGEIDGGESVMEK